MPDTDGARLSLVDNAKANANADDSAARSADSADGPIGQRELRRELKNRLAREHVLNATERLFGDHGYERTSIEQIAAASEFSVGAVYKLFENKQALLTAVLQRRFQLLIELVARVLDDDRTGMDQLLTWVDGLLQLFRTHPSYGRVLLRVYGAPLESAPDFVPYSVRFDEGLEIYERAIERGQADGSIRAGHPHWLGRLVAGLFAAHHATPADTRPDASSADGLLAVVRKVLEPAPEPGPGSAGVTS